MGNCGDCKHWDTMGFGLEKAEVGRCTLVARSWYPSSPDKMISLNVRPAVHGITEVVTRREFGCNQQEEK